MVHVGNCPRGFANPHERSIDDVEKVAAHRAFVRGVATTSPRFEISQVGAGTEPGPPTRLPGPTRCSHCAQGHRLDRSSGGKYPINGFSGFRAARARARARYLLFPHPCAGSDDELVIGFIVRENPEESAPCSGTRTIGEWRANTKSDRRKRRERWRNECRLI